ncbi:contractile injection system protein, VgrG/Pvc8 family [Asticcacaulis machinosus]|uniref:Contractile injection system protein, VgrG/Pvc8 family n=1 Tax=Asticcacaulis machinosus TaxID=2984211 RepID=A0ABT5HGT4_9CAUL|nr:contractile injection system protein, VgrG/Pvc8 family [Asticcacaulis machinosus]MDC7675393.1 contractile injection system protein, VgrG/Pvc8 family [Asticcacaulis machinosus]
MSFEKRMPKATWRITLDGRDLTDKLRPLLISLTLTEKRGEEADELELIIDDKNGTVEIPPAGKKLKVEMGWQQGQGLPIGLVDKGEFKVDEAEWEADPDKIIIRARSADFTDSYRVRRERSFVNTTVGHIVETIASENGLTAHIDPNLKSKSVPALGSGAKSDSARIMELGKRFDAVATVKMGKLIFAPIGKGQTAGGTSLPVETIDRSQCGLGARYGRAERDTYNGVEAQYHDKATGTKMTVVAGGGNGDGKPKRLRRTFASEASARQAAEAEHKRVVRSKAKMSLPLALGRPDLTPERPLKLTGYKTEINDHDWLIAEASHSMDGRGGLMTRLSLETGS